jgi:hypothetical protein
VTNWNQPMCERCWVDRHGTGRQPVRLHATRDEICAWCGYPTWAGIYVRQNPAEIPYPTLDDEAAP